MHSSTLLFGYFLRRSELGLYLGFVKKNLMTNVASNSRKPRNSYCATWGKPRKPSMEHVADMTNLHSVSAETDRQTGRDVRLSIC